MNEGSIVCPLQNDGAVPLLTIHTAAMVSGGKRKIENSARTMSRSRASSISSGMCLPPLGGAAGARSRDADEIAAVDSRSIFSIFCRFGTGPDMMGAGSSIKLQHTLAVTRPRRSMAGGAPPPGERRRRCFAVLGTTVVLHSVRCMSAGEAHECQQIRGAAAQTRR